jgi:hypothetical protein
MRFVQPLVHFVEQNSAAIELPEFERIYTEAVGKILGLPFRIISDEAIANFGFEVGLISKASTVNLTVEYKTYTVFHRLALLLEILAPSLMAFETCSFLIALGDAAPPDFDGIAMSASGDKAILIPDIYFIRFGGYEQLKANLDQALASDGTFNQRNFRESSLSYWREGLNGQWKQQDGSLDFNNQRLRLCVISADNPAIVDAKLTSFTDEQRNFVDSLTQRGFTSHRNEPRDALSFPFQIDVDGWGNAWSSLYWKLWSKRVVLKIGSPNSLKQWYYDDLAEYQNFIPIKHDLSDLLDVITTCSKLLDSSAFTNYTKISMAARRVVDRDYKYEVSYAANRIVGYLKQEPIRIQIR